MVDDVTPDATPVSVTGRDLAARALLGGAECSAKRVSELLGVSRRTLGRMVEADLTAALQDAQTLAAARTYLEASTSRGIAVAERDAAAAWLAQALRDEQPLESAARRRTSVRATKKPTPKAVKRPTNGTSPAAAAVPLPQLEALERQRQRILHRTTLLDYVLAAEQRNGAGLTLGDALAELVRDITDAARQVGTILQQIPPRAALH